MSAFKHVLAALAVAFLLSACGGGSDNSTPVPAPEPEPSPTPTPPPAPPAPTPTPPPAAEPAPESLQEAYPLLISNIATHIITPSYVALRQSAQNFANSTQTLCSGAGSLEQAQQQWLTLSQDWQAIQWLQLGPVAEQNRSVRIQFWPDNNNAVGRGLDSLLLEQRSIDAAFIATQNVGSQGLPAAEQLLFDPQRLLLDGSDAEKRCEILMAISGNIDNISVEILQAWVDGGTAVSDLINGTGPYTGVQDALEELVSNWFTHIEVAKDDKLAAPLGEQALGLPERLESSLSQSSKDNIVTNTQYFALLFTGGEQQGFENVLRDTLEQTALADAINVQFAEVSNGLNQIPGSLLEALNDPQQRQQMQTTFEQYNQLRDLLSIDFVQALDLNLGFNSNDGD